MDVCKQLRQNQFLFKIRNSPLISKLAEQHVSFRHRVIIRRRTFFLLATQGSELSVVFPVSVNFAISDNNKEVMPRAEL